MPTQSRCFPDTEFFKKILVEMFASGIGRKRKNPHFDPVKTWQKFIQMWSNALAMMEGRSQQRSVPLHLLQLERVLCHCRDPVGHGDRRGLGGEVGDTEVRRKAAHPRDSSCHEGVERGAIPAANLPKDRGGFGSGCRGKGGSQSPRCGRNTGSLLLLLLVPRKDGGEKEDTQSK